MTHTRYCLCGANLRARSSPPAAADFLTAEFDRRHDGQGHGPATQAQASRARQREERRVLAEEFAS